MTPTKPKKETTKITPSRIIRSVVRRPLISEKSQRVLEKNQYVFLVDVKANKNMVKQEVSRRYNVHVTGVNTIRIPGKTHRYGRIISKKQDVKKAIVFLKKGEKIDIA